MNEAARQRLLFSWPVDEVSAFIFPFEGEETVVMPAEHEVPPPPTPTPSPASPLFLENFPLLDPQEM